MKTSLAHLLTAAYVLMGAFTFNTADKNRCPSHGNVTITLWAATWPLWIGLVGLTIVVFDGLNDPWKCEIQK